MSKVFHAGVVGAGAISGKYIGTIQKKFPIISIDKICANHIENAQKKAAEFGLTACTFEEMLADESLDLIINLTPACAHYGIIKASLEAGKHVYSEKTMTDDPQTAFELCKLADEKGLYLGSAPDTFLGASIQTMRKAIDEGMIGDITGFNIAANRDNNILLSLFSFLRMPGGGVLYDYAVYYMTALVSLLGAVDKVAAFVRTPYPTHVNILPGHPDFGKTMETPNESQVSAILQMESGITGTMHMNCDSVMQDQGIFTIYGTKGILFGGDPNQFGSTVKFLPNGGDWQNPPKPQELPMTFDHSDESRGIGAADMMAAFAEGRQPRASKEMASHVLDILGSILKSGETGEFVKVSSTCNRPEPRIMQK